MRDGKLSKAQRVRTPFTQPTLVMAAKG